MVFYAAFNSIADISRRRLTLFMSFLVTPVLGWGSEVSCPRTFPHTQKKKKKQRIPCGSNQGLLHYESNTSPLHHTTLHHCGEVLCGSVAQCLTRNAGVLASSRTGSSGFFFFFFGIVLGQDTSEPQPSTGV